MTVKTVLKWIAAGLLGVIILVAIFFGYVAYQRSIYQPVAEMYLQRVIPELASWSDVRARPYFDTETSVTRLPEFMRACGRLGKLLRHEPPVFQGIRNSVKYSGGHLKVITYIVPATFEASKADLYLELKAGKDRFTVLKFGVTDPLVCMPRPE